MFMRSSPFVSNARRCLIPLVVALSALAQTCATAQRNATPEAAPGVTVNEDVGPREELPSQGRLEPSFFIDFPHLQDNLRLFRAAQREELSDDALRLNRHGISTEIVVRLDEASVADSQRHADALRIDREVESADGADDGLLILVSFDPNEAGSASIVFSYGQQTLPRGALTETSIREIHEQTIIPRLEEGKTFEALLLGIRQIIYLETYYPDPPPSIGDLQHASATALNVIAPLAVVAHAAMFGWLWFRVAGRAASGIVSPSIAVVSAIVSIAFLVLTSIYAQSTTGISSALLIGTLLAFHVFAPAPPRTADVRTIRAGWRHIDHVRATRGSTPARARRGRR